MARRELELTWPVTYELSAPARPRSLIVLLHGWGQSGGAILRSLRGSLPEDAALLAPDGPFPVVERKGERVRLTYGWYFFNVETGEYLIDMDPAVGLVARLVADLRLDRLPARVIGYSQGGYLAPFAALALNRVHQVVAINARFRSEVLRAPLPFRLDGLHGADDVLVDPQRARDCHRELAEQGIRGSFNLLAGAGHGISGAHREALMAVLGKSVEPSASG